MVQIGSRFTMRWFYDIRTWAEIDNYNFTYLPSVSESNGSGTVRIVFDKDVKDMNKNFFYSECGTFDNLSQVNPTKYDIIFSPKDTIHKNATIEFCSVVNDTKNNNKRCFNCCSFFCSRV